MRIHICRDDKLEAFDEIVMKDYASKNETAPEIKKHAEDEEDVKAKINPIPQIKKKPVKAHLLPVAKDEKKMHSHSPNPAGSHKSLLPVNDSNKKDVNNKSTIGKKQVSYSKYNAPFRKNSK